jgi:hypothetical protein
MSCKVKKIAVIYQNIAALNNFIERFSEDTPYHICLEQGKQGMVVDFCSFIEKFSFHQVNSIRDAHRVAGLAFDGYRFLDGMYDAETVNYLNSRIRR